MRQSEIEDIEIDLLLEALFRRYGYDFRSYARASVERRLRQYVAKKRAESISALIPQVIHEEQAFSELAQQFSIPVTEMFRDPPAFRALREHVVPVLATFPLVKAWAAGCASGEEVYSLAILLKESGLLDRSTVYGTDFNDAALQKAKQGIYAAERVQEFTKNYQESGGKGSFSEYYHASYDLASLDACLKPRITFANHNLTADGVFGEMHLILCRNVMIYFNRALQERALRLFTDSLVRGGFLVLGAKEDLQFTCVAGEYDAVDRAARIYKKRAG